MAQDFPEAAGLRLTWEDLPAHVRGAIEARLGGHVVQHAVARAGFSPAFAGAVRLADGRRFFIKATGEQLNPYSPGIYASEAEMTRALQGKARVPRLLHTVESRGWLALVYEVIDGHNPKLPWRREELNRVVEALSAQFIALTPAPVPAPPAAEILAESINGFRLLHTETPANLDPWSRRHLDRLAHLESDAPDAAHGLTLLHFDLRADNILLSEDGVYVVDWPNASVGAWWIDVLGMAPSVGMQGGPPPEEFLSAFEGAGDVDPDRIDAVLASIAGYFTHRALQPVPPGLPTLRPFQAAQGAIAREWLARRVGWE
ncbi:MAG TPA: phosphotransferase [Chloroflexota bacterium]|nr:phosphotransferase [Chloroflexota bacterium]